MTNKLEKSSFIILLITIILAPLAFIPSVYVPIDTVKTSIITFGVLISTILYFISSLKNKEISIPKNPIFVTGCLLVISILVSTILAPNFIKSFFGQGFEIGTASFLLAMFLTSMLVVKLTHKSRASIKSIYGSILISFTIVAIFHVLRLFLGVDSLTLGFLNSAVSSVIGKWGDLAIYSGIVFIVGYLSLRFGNPNKLSKIGLYVLLLLSIFFLFIVNSIFVWTSLTVVFALISLFEFHSNRSTSGGISGFIGRVPIAVTIIFVLITSITIIGIKFGDRLSLPITTKFGITQSEIILPWQLTLDVVSDTIKESPLFGEGPSRFGSQYLLHKPLEVNPSGFWSVEFGNGFSLLSTFAVTQGVVGFILWILFIIFFVHTGYKAIKKARDHSSTCFISTTFFSAMFLWLITLLYIPSHTLLFFTFVLTGAFISTLIHDHDIDLIKAEHINSILLKLKPVISIIILIVLLFWLAIFTKKVIALSYFQSGIRLLNTRQASDLPKAEMDFNSALGFDQNDTYLQALTEVNISKISNLAQSIQVQSQNTGKSPDQESIKQVGLLIEQAIGYTNEAIRIDPTNHYNYLSSARIYSVALTLQVPGAYENVKKAYTNASTYNPSDPSIYLSLARVEASQNKMLDAERYIGASLQRKANYLDAIYLLSQIQVAENKIKDAIISVQVASQINPNNPQIFFQLGFLHYNDKNYQAAIDALSTAIKLDKTYANAQYFLGLSYARINNIPDAIIQFEALAITNPDNQEVKLILDNLNKGKSPFSDAKPPIDNKPEKRSTLPIKEKIKRKS